MSTEVIVAVVGALGLILVAGIALAQARMTNRAETTAKASQARRDAEAAAAARIEAADKRADEKIAEAYRVTEAQQERLIALITDERDQLAAQVRQLVDKVAELEQRIAALTAGRREGDTSGPPTQ